VRVAVLNWRDPWHSWAGGAEQYAAEICRGLLAAGARVDFLTAREPGQARTEQRDGVRWLRSGGRWTVYPAVFGRLLGRRWTGRGYDAVLDCQNGIPFFAPWAVSRRHTPVLLVMHHVHDAQFGVHFPKPVAVFGRWLEGPVSRVAYRRATAVAVSPSTIAAMRERLGWRGPIELVHNGVRRSPDAAQPAGQPVGRAATPRVAAVGRLVRHKRMEQAAQLADALAETWPDLDVHIVGGGPDEELLRSAVAGLGHVDRVTVHGYVPHAEKDRILGSAWLHVSASHGEGWGLSVIEAAACGVPTVAYDVDGLRDAVRDGRTGWLVAPGETLADAVARALKELADPARAAEIRDACVAWAGEFDWDRSGRRMAELVAAELGRVRRKAPRR